MGGRTGVPFGGYGGSASGRETPAVCKGMVVLISIYYTRQPPFRAHPPLLSLLPCFLPSSHPMRRGTLEPTPKRKNRCMASLRCLPLIKRAAPFADMPLRTQANCKAKRAAWITRPCCANRKQCSKARYEGRCDMAFKDVGMRCGTKTIVSETALNC